MKQTTALMTAQQLQQLPDDALRYELIHGELRMSPPAGPGHGYTEMKIGRNLTNYVIENNLGIVLGETGFLLARDPDTVLAPDVAFISSANLIENWRMAPCWPGPPDLAVEVVSPSDTITRVTEKARRYLAAGAKAVWVVNPRRKTVTVYAHDAPPKIWGIADDIDGGTLLPGFRMAVRDVFE